MPTYSRPEFDVENMYFTYVSACCLSKILYIHLLINSVLFHSWSEKENRNGNGRETYPDIRGINSVLIQEKT